ncbi:hypothetical protein YW5DRAFT_06545 [Streptomyces sp. Ncost-T6T-1]|nr:hypothetical protein YW5DRAFT_06545 [Streptomyces sp. Ncost-T6T-1]
MRCAAPRRAFPIESAVSGALPVVRERHSKCTFWRVVHPVYVLFVEQPEVVIGQADNGLL